MVKVEVIADSVSPDGIRLTTVQCRYPRMIHSEVLTHRDFSRNGRSSRAVPFSVLVKEEPYLPEFASNKPGMVAGEVLTGTDMVDAQDAWLRAAKACQKAAQELTDLGVHKQWTNRMLEWFGYIDVLITSTEWNNFFALRDEAGAQPEIRELARGIKNAMAVSKPKLLEVGKWHLPYINFDEKLTSPDWEMYFKIREMVEPKHPGWELKHNNPTAHKAMHAEVESILRKISTARCARLTIRPFDGDSTIEKELKRYELLMVSRPVHASPAEHIATPDTHHGAAMKGVYHWDRPYEHGNFNGWRQFRKQIPHNTVR